ncbi:MAG TPA: hypothetical protein VKE42_00215 [Candidatus Cybelea sp.]|nr:hypothetical protein [Candidatus Cybelea sp.]
MGRSRVVDGRNRVVCEIPEVGVRGEALARAIVEAVNGVVMNMKKLTWREWLCQYWLWLTD